MRNIGEVASQISALIDDDSVKGQISRVVSDSVYTAPELMYVRWNELHSILVGYIDTHTELDDNFVKIFAIFSYRPEDEVRLGLEEYFKNKSLEHED